MVELTKAFALLKEKDLILYSAFVCGIVMVTENFDNIYHMAQKSLVSMFPI